jgi:hypothetical protein
VWAGARYTFAFRLIQQTNNPTSAQRKVLFFLAKIKKAESLGGILVTPSKKDENALQFRSDTYAHKA